MIDIDTLENSLRTWITGITTQDVIFAHQNGPRPPLPYVVVNIMQSISIGHPETDMVKLPDNSIDITRSGVVDIPVSVHAFGDGSFTLATKLRDSLHRITVQDQLYTDGLGLRKAGDAQDIPQPVNQKFEQRAHFDAFFYVRSNDIENIATIRKVEITNELDDYTTVINHPDD